MSLWTRMVLTSFADFVNQFGTAVTAAMLQAGEIRMPSKGVLILGLITGAMAFWSHMKASLAEAPK